MGYKGDSYMNSGYSGESKQNVVEAQAKPTSLGQILTFFIDKNAWAKAWVAHKQNFRHELCDWVYVLECMLMPFVIVIDGGESRKK